MPLLAGFTGQKAIFDAEVYPNYVSLNFQDVDIHQITRYRITPGINEGAAAEAHYRAQTVVVTYNGHGYDDHILKAAFAGLDCQTIYEVGDGIINSGGRRYSPFLNYGYPTAGWPISIDLARNVATGDAIPNLKALGARFGYKVLQELPLPPGTYLTQAQTVETDEYNIHDLAITRLVLEHLDAGLETRRLFGVQFLSLTDSQLGEKVIKSEYLKVKNAEIEAISEELGEEPDHYARFPKSPKREWIKGGIDILNQMHEFKTRELLDLVQKVQGWSLHWKLVAAKVAGEIPELQTPSFNTKVTLADKTYSFGMGGLHSKDAPLIIGSDDEFVLIDIDASSFYPVLIMQNHLAPEHVDKVVFCEVFDELIQRRLAAKRAGNKKVAKGLKDAINAAYGKFSYPKSGLLDPPKGAAVTLNGQMALLRLIEELLTVNGLSVISANTDGVMVRLPRNQIDAFHTAVNFVAGIYGVSMEEVIVDRLCRVNINEFVLSYQENGKTHIKAKGTRFNDGTADDKLSKKTDQRIIKQAAIAYLLYNTPVAETIHGCGDIVLFANYNSLNKGWYAEDHRGNRLSQRHNRWYESTSGGKLYKVNPDGMRSKYAKVNRARIINDIPDQFPDDLDYEFYIAAAQKIVDEALNPPTEKVSKRSKEFDKLTDDEREEIETRQQAETPDIEFLRSIDLNHYRDLYIGRCRVNPFDSMKAVMGILWKDNALQLTKADLIWCFESFDSGEKYFHKRDKRRSLLSLIDWLVNNVVPTDKEVLPEDDFIAPVTVKVRDREPGGGKSHDALAEIVTNGPNIYWWAINKIDPIASERQQELSDLANAAGVRINFEPIHSEADGQGTMKMRIDRRMKAINDDPAVEHTTYVTLITHKTLVDHYLSEVRGILLIDEPVQVWEQRHFDFHVSHRTIRELVQPIGIEAPDAYDGDINPTIKADTQAVRLTLTEEGRRQCDDETMKHDTIYGGKHRWIIEQADKTSGRVFALAEQWNTLEDPDAGGMDVLAMLHPQHIAHFDETWMMAAYFKDLMVYQLWSDLYDVTWEFAPNTGWQREIPLRDRVTLHYILENRGITDTYLTNKGDPKRRRAMARAVVEFYGQKPYIWSTNKTHRDTGDYAALLSTVTDLAGNNRDAYLSPRANGINCYQHLHGAAWLGTIKLPDTLLKFLERIWGKNHAQGMTLREYELYATLQFLARANSRRFDSRDQVVYIVADQEQADYVRGKWDLDPARVLPLPMRDEVKADLDDLASKGRGKKPSKTEDERREYQRQKKAKQRAAKPEDKAAEAARKRTNRAKKKPKE